MTAYVVKINNDVITKVFECADDACLYVESKGFIFLGEDEYKFEFSRGDNSAMVIKCNFIKKKAPVFKVGDELKFKSEAIDSGRFAAYLKVGDSVLVDEIIGDTVYLKIKGTPHYQVVNLPRFTEDWFERVEMK